MSKTVNLRLRDDEYKKVCKSAKNDNRTLANFMVNATLRYIQNIEYVDESEHSDIDNNEEIQDDLKKSREDIKAGRISKIKEKKFDVRP